MEQLNKDRDAAKREMDALKLEHANESEKNNKILKTLEEELANKADKIKSQETMIKK